MHCEPQAQCLCSTVHQWLYPLLRNQPSLFSSISDQMPVCLLCTLGPDQHTNPYCQPRVLSSTGLFMCFPPTRLWVHLCKPVLSTEPGSRRCSNIYPFIYLFYVNICWICYSQLKKIQRRRKGKRSRDINPSFNYFATEWGSPHLCQSPCPKYQTLEKLLGAPSSKDRLGVGLVTPEMANKEVLWGLDVPSRAAEPVESGGGLLGRRPERQTKPLPLATELKTMSSL